MRNKNISLEDVVYTVRPGDTLGNIASKYANNKNQYLALAAFNDINNPNVIKPGQQIVIPRHLIDNSESNPYNVGTEMEQVNRGYNTATQAPREEPFEYVPASNNTDNDEEAPLTVIPVINKKSPNYSIRRRSRVAPNRSKAVSNNNVNRSNNTTRTNNVTRSNNNVSRPNPVNRTNNVTRGTSIVRRNNVTSRQVQNTKSTYVNKPKTNNSIYTSLRWLDNSNNTYTSSRQANSRNNNSRSNTRNNNRNIAPTTNKGFSGLMDRLNQRFGTRPEDVRRQIAIVNDYRKKPHKISFWR